MHMNNILYNKTTVSLLLLSALALVRSQPIEGLCGVGW